MIQFDQQSGFVAGSLVLWMFIVGMKPKTPAWAHGKTIAIINYKRY